jgi:hypothetical protein
MVDPEVSNPADLISQKEKRRILAEDRLARSTYFGHANDVELEMGGRFAKLTPTSVIGASARSVYPQQPEGSPWRDDPVPNEMPLGYSVEEHEVVGEAHERTGSSITAARAVEDGGPASKKFKRRI